MPKTKVTVEIQEILEIAKKIENARQHADSMAGSVKNGIWPVFDIAFESEIELRAFQERLDELVEKQQKHLDGLKSLRIKGHLKRDVDREV